MRSLKITTHAALDITWGQLFKNFLTAKHIEIKSFTTPETEESFEENFETFTFKSLDAISEFLTKAPSLLIESLATSTGDDSYFDYTWSFLAQYKEILLEVINHINGIDLKKYSIKDQIHEGYLLRIQIPRTIKLNIELFNEVILNHQDSNGDIHNKGLYYAGNIEPINI